MGRAGNVGHPWGGLTKKGPPKEAMVWPLGDNDALDFERWLCEFQAEPMLAASGPEVGAKHREVDILEAVTALSSTTINAATNGSSR
jgi:hypothetical protein